jgi:hypothetical protein
MRFPLGQSGIEATLEQFWPVGSLYVSISPTNPALLFGFGTWAAFGEGRCLVGVDPGDTDFDAAEKTAGSKTVALTGGGQAHPNVQPSIAVYFFKRTA